MTVEQLAQAEIAISVREFARAMQSVHEGWFELAILYHRFALRETTTIMRAIEASR